MHFNPLLNYVTFQQEGGVKHIKFLLVLNFHIPHMKTKNENTHSVFALGHFEAAYYYCPIQPSILVSHVWVLYMVLNITGYSPVPCLTPPHSTIAHTRGIDPLIFVAHTIKPLLICTPPSAILVK